MNFRDLQIANNINWRKFNIADTEWGNYNKKQYEHLVPKQNWSETIWIDIKDDLIHYIRSNHIQTHTAVNSLISSWVLCANLYFPIRTFQNFRNLFFCFCNKRYQIK